MLYQLVERHYPDFKETLSEQGKKSPNFVEREFDEFLRCVRLEHDFLRVVVAIVNTRNSLHLAASDVGFAPVEVLEEWLKVLRFG